jgi:hypothetical protein
MFGIRGYVITAIVVFLCCGFLSQVHAQNIALDADTIISELDTLKVMNTAALPGDSVALRVYLANHSIEVGGLNFLIQFDSTYIHPAYNWAEIQWQIDNGDSNNGPVNFEMVERGCSPTFGCDSSLFQWTQTVNCVDTSFVGKYVVTGVFVTDFARNWDVFPTGAGVFVQFYVHIKPDAPLGTVIRIDIFDEQASPGEPGRKNEFFDPDGLIGILPTQVDGFLTVGEPGPGEQNSPPYFVSPGSGQVFNVEQGNTVQFNVSASDPDAGQPLTLSMVSGPPGASFETTYGSGSVSRMFTWETNFTHLGSYNATFNVVDDSAASASVTATINVTSGPPPEEDFLFTTSKSPGGFIEGGIPGSIDVSVPVNLNDLNTLFGIEYDVSYDYSVMTLDSIVPTDRLTGFDVYSQSIGAGTIKVVAFGLDNETIQPATSTSAIFHCWFSINLAALPGWYRFSLNNGRASLQPGQPSTDLLVDTLGAVAVDRMGDVNLDTLVDVGDLVTVVGHIVDNYELELRQFRAGNINGDSEVNVVDLVSIINIIFTGAPAPPAPKPAYFAGDAVVGIAFQDELIGGWSRLALEADLPTHLAGAQFDLRYNPNDVELGQPELTRLSGGLQLRYNDGNEGCMRVLMYSPGSDPGDIIGPGIGALAVVPVRATDGRAAEKGSVSLEDVVLSDPYGQEIPVTMKHGQLPSKFTLEQNYPNPFNPDTRIRFSINGDGMQRVRLVVYNILGQSIVTLLDKDLAPGSYEATWNGTDASGSQQASGVYFYSLIVGDSRETKKMVLAK